jgi:hypothetical protein
MRPSGFTFRCRPRAGEADPRTGDARQGPAVLSLNRLAWRRLCGIDGFAAAPIRATTIAFAAVPLGSGCDRCPQAAGAPRSARGSASGLQTRRRSDAHHQMDGGTVVADGHDGHHSGRVHEYVEHRSVAAVGICDEAADGADDHRRRVRDGREGVHQDRVLGLAEGMPLNPCGAGARNHLRDTIVATPTVSSAFSGICCSACCQ